MVSASEAEEEYGITPADEPRTGSYDAVILAVAHKQFREMGAGLFVRSKPRTRLLYGFEICA